MNPSSSIGSIVIGDMNVHHKAWLQYSNGTTPEGTALFQVCARQGLQQLVRSPTRDKYLLDLALTDLPKIRKVKVMSKISDHNMVFVEIQIKVQISKQVTRPCWIWKQAKWSSLRERFSTTNWNDFFAVECVDTVVQQITDYILSCAKEFVPIREQAFPKKSHPWLTEECIGQVARKHSTEGTDEYDANRNACTEALLQGFQNHAARTKTKISELPVSSKKW